MRKRKRKVTNVTVMNNEIDYDKLAEAIAKATSSDNVQAVEAETVEEKMKVRDFLKLLGCIIVNKKPSNGTMVSGLFAMLVSSIFNTVAIFGVLILGAGVANCIGIILNSEWKANLIAGNIITILLELAFLAVIFVFSIIFRASANEMEREKDRNYIVSVFSGIVSFAALVVAVLSLLKGVG